MALFPRNALAVTDNWGYAKIFLNRYTSTMSASVERPLLWIGSSKRDLMTLPVPVRKFFGHALDFAQRGESHVAAKVLKGFGGAGVLEVMEETSGAPIARYTPCGSPKQYSCCIASRRRANKVLLPRRKTSISSVHV